MWLDSHLSIPSLFVNMSVSMLVALQILQEEAKQAHRQQKEEAKQACRQQKTNMAMAKAVPKKMAMAKAVPKKKAVANVAKPKTEKLKSTASSSKDMPKVPAIVAENMAIRKSEAAKIEKQYKKMERSGSFTCSICKKKKPAADTCVHYDGMAHHVVCNKCEAGESSSDDGRDE